MGEKSGHLTKEDLWMANKQMKKVFNIIYH